MQMTFASSLCSTVKLRPRSKYGIKELSSCKWSKPSDSTCMKRIFYIWCQIVIDIGLPGPHGDTCISLHMFRGLKALLSEMLNLTWARACSSGLVYNISCIPIALDADRKMNVGKGMEESCCTLTQSLWEHQSGSNHSYSTYDTATCQDICATDTLRPIHVVYYCIMDLHLDVRDAAQHLWTLLLCVAVRSKIRVIWEHREP